MVPINPSMALKWHLASSLFSCVLASVSFLTREASLCASFFRSSMIIFFFRCCVFLSLSMSCVFDCIFSSFACHHSCRYYLPFPDSRLYSIVHISEYTARLSTSTIIIIVSPILIGQSWTCRSNSSSTSNDFNYCFIFIQYHFSSNDVSTLIRSFVLFFCFFSSFVQFSRFSLEVVSLYVWLTGFSLCSRCDSDVCYANRLERSVQTA